MHQLPVVPFLRGHLPGADEDAQQVPGTASNISQLWGWLIKRRHKTHLTCKLSQKVVDNHKICLHYLLVNLTLLKAKHSI